MYNEGVAADTATDSNGDETMFTKGQTLYGKGLNMNCHPVVCKVRFVEYLPQADEHGLDCVIETDGFLIHDKASDLHTTPTVLRKQCRAERAAWLARVDQQMAAMRNG